MIDFNEVKPRGIIKYVGNNWIAYSGNYTAYPIEETYVEGKCPEEEKGKLVIIEFMNNGDPMFFTLDRLNPKEWELVI